MSVTVQNTNEVARLKSGLDAMSQNLAVMLPSHIPLEQFKRVALMAVQRTPDLLRADRKKLFLALQRAAGDGLLPDGREGAIVMFGSDPTWMPMVAGLRKLARNSGDILSITSQVVYQGETFRVVLGDEERIEHERNIELMGNAKPIAVYAIAKLKSGEIIREIMSAADVEKVRNVSRAKNGTTWTVWRDEMWRKSCERRLSKHLPLSTDRPDDMRLRSALEDTATSSTMIDLQADAPDEQPAPIAGGKLDALEHMADDVPDETEPPPFYPDPQREAADIIPGIDDAPAPRNGTLIEAIRRVSATTHPDEMEDLTSSPRWKASVKTLADDANRELNDAVNAARRRLAASVRNADIAA